MTSIQKTSSRIFPAIIALLGWFALIAQLYLQIENRKASLPESIIRYFSYFTILVNIIVALCSTFLLFRTNSRISNFFTRQSVVAAAALYITIVGIVYNTLLRQVWDPQGLQLIVDNLLHSIIPFLFLVLWLFTIPKKKLKWNTASWMTFPLIYIIYTLVRGPISGFYPYPFFDVNILGFNRVLLNCAGFTLVFILASFLFVLTGKLTNRKSKREN